MSDIIAATKQPMADIMETIRLGLRNPSSAFEAGIDALEKATNGEISFYDPTNPTVKLLETVSVTSSAAVTEAISLLRRQYPNLAESPEDIYLHMSDWDFVDRFASPCKEKITMLFGFEALERDMVRDEKERCKKAIIPRDSYVKLGLLTFTLMYPIVIRYFDTGTITVSYDTEKTSIFQPLETNIINYETNTLPTGERFIMFEVEMLQLNVDMVVNSVQMGRPFKMTVGFDDQFFYCRAFLRNSQTGGLMKEIKTTHSDLNYDRREPTVVLEVNGQNLTMSVPMIYLRDANVVGEIIFLIYTTKGDVNENLAGKDSEFTLRGFDEAVDVTDYTTLSLTNVPRLAQSNAFTTGGRNGLNFEQLRERVIFNSVGPRQTPITNIQFEDAGKRLGFDLILNTDVTTNRIFLATQKLPKPRNSRLATAANIGIETLVVEQGEIVSNKNVKLNGDRWVLTPNCLYEQENGVLRILAPEEVEAIRMKPQAEFINIVNNRRFLFSPFHWVLDNSSRTFSSRPYYLDGPTASPINFVRQNQTLGLPVNTVNRVIERSPTGYTLRIRVQSGQHFKALPDARVGVQLRFTPVGAQTGAFIKGYQTGIASNGEREFAFDIKTNFNIDDDHKIQLLDAAYSEGFDLDVWTNLSVKFELFICTDSIVVGYEPNLTNGEYGAFQFPYGFVPITHESITVTFGLALTNLWSRARPLTYGSEYELHEHDIPLRYTEDVYEADPLTGRLFTIVNGAPVFNILHRKGDIVKDHLGNPFYEFRANTPVIDNLTKLPKLKPDSKRFKEIDLLLIDGRHYFVNDPSFLSYNQDLVTTLLSWITEDLATIQRVALEKTKVFFHPRSQLGECSVDRGDGINITIPTEQSPVLDIYVPALVYSDNLLRESLQKKAIQLLDVLLSGKEINKTVFEKALSNLFGSAVTSLKLSNLGGALDLHYARVVSPTKELSLKRVLEAQSDGTFIIREDVSFNFIKVGD